MIPFFYSMSLDAVVVGNLIEDSSTSIQMRSTSNGVLTVKNQFIEQQQHSAKMVLTPTGDLYSRFFIEVGTTSSIPPIPPIPEPVGSITYDDFKSYVPLTLLEGLNSGSNEWSNITPLTKYVTKGITFIGIQEWDDFNSYAEGSSLNPSLTGAGGGMWSGSYNYISNT